MLLLMTDIDWDTDGEDPIACNLPENVVVVGIEAGDNQENVTNKVSDAFGWCINSVNCSEVETNPLFISSVAVVDISII